MVMMAIAGTILGGVGVVLAHVLTVYAGRYALILVFPIVMALFLGAGLSLGAGMGGCTRLPGGAVVVVLLCALMCYGALLFLNDFYAGLTPQPANVAQEFGRIAAAGGTVISDFLTALPALAQHRPVMIGTIFDRALFKPIQKYLVFPGLTAWDAERGALVFDERVKTWMAWVLECLLVFVIALVMTRGGDRRRASRNSHNSDDTPHEQHKEHTMEEHTEGCRDCKVCTRLGIVKIFYAPFTFLYKVLFSWNIGLFLRRCPQCEHFMSAHQRRPDGSFKD